VKEEEYLVVRWELARRLGRGAIPEKAWQMLRTHYGDLLEAAWVLGEDEYWADLSRHAKPLCDMARGEGGQQKTTTERIPAQLRVSDIERSRVFSEYVAQVAADAPAVERFRDRVLNNSLLTAEQARTLLRSPVAAHWGAFVFNVLQVPLVGHTHQVKERRKDDKGPYSLVEVSTTRFGITRRIKDRRPLEPGAWEVVDPPENARGHDRAAREVKDYKVLPFPGEDDRTHRVLVKGSSILGYLHKEVGRLLKDYPWFEPDAVWFMLTGEVPWVAPLTWRARIREPETALGDGFRHGFITLTVDLRVPGETVRQVYQEVQKGLLGGDNRPIGPKSCTIFSFVNERVGPTPLPPKEKRRVGRELVQAWDKRYPQWAYDGDTRTFWRDYNLARTQLAFPTCEWSAKHTEDI
jgi:hypothetical protein